MVIGLHPDADRESVASAVRDAGASDVRPQSPSLPDVIVAEFPDNDETALIVRLSVLDGVRYVEPDVLQEFS